MTRVAVIGNAGGGKSGLARRLAKARALPYYSIDQIQWKPGWQRVADARIRQWHEEVIGQSHWIIDGFGPWADIERRIECADTVILVDHPLWVHLWWATKRQIKCVFAKRSDGPEGCPMLPATVRLYRMIWSVHKTLRPRLLEAIDRHRSAKAVFHIRSPGDLKDFCARYCSVVPAM